MRAPRDLEIRVSWLAAARGLTCRHRRRTWHCRDLSAPPSAPGKRQGGIKRPLRRAQVAQTTREPGKCLNRAPAGHGLDVERVTADDPPPIVGEADQLQVLEAAPRGDFRADSASAASWPSPGMLERKPRRTTKRRDLELGLAEAPGRPRSQAIDGDRGPTRRDVRGLVEPPSACDSAEPASARELQARANPERRSMAIVVLDHRDVDRRASAVQHGLAHDLQMGLRPSCGGVIVAPEPSQNGTQDQERQPTPESDREGDSNRARENRYGLRGQTSDAALLLPGM